MAHVEEFQEADVVYSIPACKPGSNENCKLATNWSFPNQYTWLLIYSRLFHAFFA
jgi:hypothetical protein